MDARPLDLVLFGATGYTGALVAHQLAANGSTALRWAIAGRSAAKLEALAAELSASSVRRAPLPQLLVADATDRADMERIAKQARVVCSTAGPFARYGSELVRACAEAGTSYCDITGEVQWVREMIDAYDQRATATGARLVHCCGFDSIPSDLGTWALQREMIARTGAPARTVTAYVGDLKAGLSGGSAASIVDFVDKARVDRAAVRKIASPYSLNPDPSFRGPDKGGLSGVGYDRRERALTLPFIMAPTNERIVRRSHALAGFPWGHDFRYSEVATAPLTVSGLARAFAIAGGTIGLVAAASSRPLRPLLDRWLPKPGEGPSEAGRAAGHYTVTLVGERDGATLRYVVSDRADPGYGSTSKMLAQAALCLAFDPLEPRAGSLTPSTAMGEHLLKRLRDAGLTFAVA